MNIFVDYHHSDLLYSLYLLLEKRLGHKLYRPIGLDWYENGYWKIAEPYNNNPGTISQYLKDSQNLKYPNGEPHRLVTLDEFKEIQFDIVIASYLPHIKPFKDLIEKHKPQAKLIHQMGNDWSNSVDYNDVKNLLVSCAKFDVPTGVNAVFYHQEFDTDIFKNKRTENPVPKKICSFVNALKDFPSDINYIKLLQESMPDWDFKLYGASNPDGALTKHQQIAKEMQSSAFGLHLKEGGDGFGHIIHNWFACGIPPIVRKLQYEGKLAGELMIDGETCLFVDNLSPVEVSKKIKRYMEPYLYEKLRRGAYNAFRSIVNYDSEETRVKEFLYKLI